MRSGRDLSGAFRPRLPAAAADVLPQSYPVARLHRHPTQVSVERGDTAVVTDQDVRVAEGPTLADDKDDPVRCGTNGASLRKKNVLALVGDAEESLVGRIM